MLPIQIHPILFKIDVYLWLQTPLLSIFFCNGELYFTSLQRLNLHAVIAKWKWFIQIIVEIHNYS